MLSLSLIFTGNDPLSGIFALMLTAPWSLFLGQLLPDSAFNGIAGGLVAAAVGAAINGALLYVVSRWLVGRLAK